MAWEMHIYQVLMGFKCVVFLNISFIVSIFFFFAWPLYCLYIIIKDYDYLFAIFKLFIIYFKCPFFFLPVRNQKTTYKTKQWSIVQRIQEVRLSNVSVVYVNKEYTKECVAQFINYPKRCLEDVMIVMTIFWGFFLGFVLAAKELCYIMEIMTTGIVYLYLCR